MANQLYFSRDTKVYIEFNGVTWEVPVLDGFSFSQANNTSEITLAEMEDANGVSRRGRRAFNDSLAAGEWSFSTYVRPFASAAGGAIGDSDEQDGGSYDALGSADLGTDTHAIEEVLWAMMAGATTYDQSANSYKRGSATVITPASGSSAINFASSNVSVLQPDANLANIYFVMGDANRTVIKLVGAIVNEASIDFEIDGIATIAWSGNCSEVVDFTGSVVESAAEPNHNATTNDAGTIAIGDVWLDTNDSHRLYVMTNVSDGTEEGTKFINEKITDSTTFIRNRLTSLTVNGSNTTGLNSSYDVTLTGGNITISNNITFITPEELGIVNVPVGHVTGTRSVSGSFNCYLTLNTANKTGTGSGADRSRDLFEDLRALTSTVTNSVALTFSIGGSAGNRLEVSMPTCHLEIPTHSIEDVISLETTFQALPSAIDGTNEMTLTYRV